MEPLYIIKKPILTEQTTAALEAQNQVTFEVDRRATKTEIKEAVEALFKVKVEGVQTQVRKGGSKRSRFGWVDAPVTKKATVRLAEGQSIDLF